MNKIQLAKDPTTVISTSHTTSLFPGNTDFHLHNSFEIYILLNGNLNYFVNHNCYHITRGDILIFNSQEIHKATNLSKEPFERITIQFNPSVISSYSTEETDLLACFQNKEPGENNLIHLKEKDMEQLLVDLKSLKESQEGYGSDLLPKITLIQILIMLNRFYKVGETENVNIVSSKIQPILKYIEDNISQNLSLDVIADDLAINKHYLCHIFKQETGSTIFQYLLLKRVALAKKFLAMGKSVTETCYSSGFNDYTNFIRCFKKITGITPGKYAKARR